MSKSTREQWLNRFVAAARPVFEAAGYPIPVEVRVSVGFPSAGARGKSIGECWSKSASKDGHFEIFIHPTLGESARIADVLTHELVHAAVGLEAKHGPKFGACARALGLEGKLTATVAGPRWHAWADKVLKRLGPIPHASLSGRSSAKPKQSTRLLKCECQDCGFTFRATRKWVESAGAGLRCPDFTCEGVVTVE